MPRVTSGPNAYAPSHEPSYSPRPFPVDNVYDAQPGYQENNGMHGDHVYIADPAYQHGQQTVVYAQPGVVHVDQNFGFGAPQTVIIQQPGQELWAQPMPPATGCPPGLEHLIVTDQIMVKQKKEWLEVFSGFETTNKYIIYGKHGEQLYFAVEDSDFCSRQCLGKLRSFDMGIYDGFRRQIMNIHRPFNCDNCCCPCCLQVMEVQSPPGVPIGYLYQEWACCIPKFRVANAKQETVLRIEGPCCTSSCFGSDVQFQILTADGSSQLGLISKQWRGIAEFFTDADTFGLQFPVDLDVTVKGTLLAACFLIDFMYFEESSNNNR